MTRTWKTIDYVFLMLIVSTIAFFAGQGIENKWGDRGTVPACAEDELLQAKDFPYTDTDNLKCIHIDELQTPIMNAEIFCEIRFPTNQEYRNHCMFNEAQNYEPTD